VGVCFSFEAPRTRREAERLLSVWEYGNNCRNITTFEAPAATTLFIGKVNAGDFYPSGLGVTGSQVFVEMAEFRRRPFRKLGPERVLDNDMGPYVVVRNKEPHRRRFS
jgi:hypothetical protein